MFVPVSVDNTQSQSEQQRENENNIRISGTPQTQKAELLLLDDFFDTTVSDWFPWLDFQSKITIQFNF